MDSRVFIVEDHTRLRQMLAELVAQMEGFDVCGCSASAEEALTQLFEARADLLLIDISLPAMSGIDLLVEVQRRSPTLGCIMLTAHRSTQYEKLTRDNGARGYVDKSQTPKLEGILRHIRNGGTHINSAE